MIGKVIERYSMAKHRAYERKRANLVSATIDNSLATFERQEQLPTGYGVGVDERSVEFPWAFSKGLHGRVLDAGGTLNHPHIIERLWPRIESLDVTTLVPGSEPFHSNKISYLFADLRALPLQDELYDVIASLSTLEHVGMDNTGYGEESSAAEDPDRELHAAMVELRRILKPGGQLLISVPYGEDQPLGWFRQFNRGTLASMIEAFTPSHSSVEYFKYEPTGWRRAEEAECADALYQVVGAPATDQARAARAVACVSLTK